MRLFALTLLSLVCFTIFAADGFDARTAELIKQLGDESYDKRQDASDKLSRYTSEYIKKFLEESKTHTDEEIASRLRDISYAIFCIRELPQDEKWQRVMGAIDMDFNYLWSRWDFPHQKEDGEWERAQKVVGLRVLATWGETDKKLLNLDMITHIDGEQVREFADSRLAWRAGKEYEFTVLRAKNQDVVQERGSFDPDNDEFETIKVRVKATEKHETEINLGRLAEARADAWARYHQVMYPQPPGADDKKPIEEAKPKKGEITLLEWLILCF